MNIQQLEDQISELIKKDKELQDLKNHQREILIEKSKEFEEVITLYLRKEIKFSHPKYQLKTLIGPIMGVQEQTEKVFIYHPTEKRVYSMHLGETFEDSVPVSWLELINDGHFENAIDGFNYLIDMQADYLDFYNKEITKLKQQIEQYK